MVNLKGISTNLKNLNSLTGSGSGKFSKSTSLSTGPDDPDDPDTPNSGLENSLTSEYGTEDFRENKSRDLADSTGESRIFF